MEQVADKETCSMEYKKGWEEEEYIFLHLQRGLTIGWKSVRECKNGR